MRTEQLHALLKIIQCGSINKASAELFTSRQQLAASVKSLEQEFGVEIFSRKNKGVELTPEGEKIVHELAPFLHRIEGLKQDFRTRGASKEPAGTLHIYREGELFLDKWPQFIPFFKKKFPNLQIRAMELDAQDIYPLLHQPECQIGINFFFEEALPLIPDSLEFIPTYTRIPVVYAARHSPFARTHKTTSLAAILKEPLIEFTHSGSDDVFLTTLFLGTGRPNIQISVNNFQMFYQLLLEGRYLCVTSKPARYDVSPPDISAIPIRDKRIIHAGFLINKAFRHNPIIQLFIKEYMEFYKQAL
ncbi:LysR family transcriptional regulator [uncultured Mailhella sp.]|uniref:LysR family transcriptional regulator n=1 Tax=uncultured Mailhella sp. TaxID=1981031 RepID=UPI0025E4EB2D|nr:LysR family transcriptional regulator [uncultured Mailhella sp.]